MTDPLHRRDFLKLAGLGIAVFVPGSAVSAGAGPQKMNESFYFCQLSDTHWSFSGPSINPDSEGTLKSPRRDTRSTNFRL